MIIDRYKHNCNFLLNVNFYFTCIDVQDKNISSTQDKTTTQIEIDNLEENVHQHIEV